jgi:heptosyltransferase-2
LKAALATVDLAISGDSGPMHLATALGRPTLALFGSSVRAFGFAPLGESRVLEVSGLSCRPCGVHGRDHCWRRHWRCLRDLTPEMVVAEAKAMLAAREGRER